MRTLAECRQDAGTPRISARRAADRSILRLILDVSRLMFGVHRVAPTGIDRVEMAYARQAQRWPASIFVAEGPWGYAALERTAADRLLDALEETWSHGEPPHAPLRYAARGAAAAWTGLAAGRGRGALASALDRRRGGPAPVFTIVSHRALDRPRGIAALRQAGAAFVALVHDVIPLSHPEYARPLQSTRHAARIATVAALADGVLANSHATAAALTPLLAAHGARPAMAVAPLGVPRAVTAGGRAQPEGAPPYFAMLSTIEPRKNHLLLLQLWRDLAGQLGPAAPRLLLFGRRGWAHGPVLDLLARCPPLRSLVEQAGPLNDARVAEQLAGSRALLFPSFAEGYGLPLAEALASGVPAIASDLPALREVGGTVPDWLDPLDGIGWRQAVLDYAVPDSPRRAAQLARMPAWSRPGWDTHFAVAERLMIRAALARAAPARDEAEAMRAGAKGMTGATALASSPAE